MRGNSPLQVKRHLPVLRCGKGATKKQTFNSAQTMGGQKKANDYPAFRYRFSTELCRFLLNFAYDGEEVNGRCANVIVAAQLCNILGSF